MSSGVVLATPEQMEALGRHLAGVLRRGDVLILTGELGAGKTTLTRGIGEGLGIRGTVTSPTFVLASTHPTRGEAPLVHVDAYRLHDALEVDDLGLDPAASITVVEWGEPFAEAFGDAWCELVLERPMGGVDPDAPLDGPEPRRVLLLDHGAPELFGRLDAVLTKERTTHAVDGD